MFLEELHAHPSMWDRALDLAEHGSVVRLVGDDGRRVTAIVPTDLIDELLETVEVLSDSDAVRSLAEAREAVARGDVVRGRDAVRRLLDERP